MKWQLRAPWDCCTGARLHTRAFDNRAAPEHAAPRVSLEMRALALCAWGSTLVPHPCLRS